MSVKDEEIYRDIIRDLRNSIYGEIRDRLSIQEGVKVVQEVYSSVDGGYIWVNLGFYPNVFEEQDGYSELIGGITSVLKKFYLSLVSVELEEETTSIKLHYKCILDKEGYIGNKRDSLGGIIKYGL